MVDDLADKLLLADHIHHRLQFGIEDSSGDVGKKGLAVRVRKTVGLPKARTMANASCVCSTYQRGVPKIEAGRMTILPAWWRSLLEAASMRPW